MPNKWPLNKSDQLAYLLQWFQEYSEMQKDDFLKVLIEAYAPATANSLANSVDSMNVSDRPPSIFQCRMKLFNEWIVNWSDEEKSDFLSHLKILDEKFIENFYDSLDSSE
ncbi:uncharacterized protein C14orf119 [Centruroides vittatus]|uniref:uncharacterized protein C14orf119 n=1 Tax=Centruroides vittatus TaxID=120091 RepID=UPI00350FC64D